MPEYKFPPPGDPYINEMTQFYQFWAGRWSSFNESRTRAAVRSSAEVKITLPFPRAVLTDNTVQYNEMGAQIGGGIYERGIVDFFDARRKLDGSEDSYLIDTLLAPFTTAGGRLSGGDTIRYDDTETNFLPGAKRKHSFEFLLVAKTAEQAVIASKIAYAFQLYTHPTADNASSYTMQHPFIWSFQALNKNGPSGWDNQPLVSVLQSTRVSKIPFNNIPYTVSTGNFQPVGTVINLAFVELEPALRFGESLVSRSERIYGGDDGSANSLFY